MVSLPTLTGRRWGMSESTVKRFYGSNEPDALETAYAINDAGQIVGRRSDRQRRMRDRGMDCPVKEGLRSNDLFS
jgi:hypothetical protein